MGVSRVAFVVHKGRPAAVALWHELQEWLERRGVAIGEDGAGLVVSLGGDGTMLRAAQVAHATDAPLLGVNLGSLGYLPEVAAGDALGALERALDGDFRTEERMMLSCTARSGHARRAFAGLNEVLVERQTRYRTVRLAVRIEGEMLAEFAGDGVLVSTPTGSTAYALSAGGPIVAPDAHCLVLVPVCAHMIFSRPVVLSSDGTVEIEVTETHSVASLSLDGVIGWDLPPGATVTVGRHPRPLRLIRLAGPGFLERLRSKLDLPVPRSTT